MSIIDLRSDTVTQPTDEMRKAMSLAEVGDDVFEEDRTVKELEDLAAEMLGKERGLFVPSGTMGNLIALLSHTQPGDEVILEADSHIFFYEVGGISRIAGLVPRQIPGQDGLISPEQVKAAIRPENIHFPKTTLLCLENTHNRSGGAVLPQGNVAALAKLVKENRMKLHLDGARVFNAATSLEKSVGEVVEPFDSVMCCLSKGLAAPVGSVIVGSASFIQRARRYRKMLGGGMRQVGVLAAAGLIALKTMTLRLHEDHLNARRLGEGLGNISGLKLTAEVQTNMVMLEITKPNWQAANLLELWRSESIMALAVDPQRIRLVTHYQISSSDIEHVLTVTAKGLGNS